MTAFYKQDAFKKALPYAGAALAVAAAGAGLYASGAFDGAGTGAEATGSGITPAATTGTGSYGGYTPYDPAGTPAGQLNPSGSGILNGAGFDGGSAISGLAATGGGGSGGGGGGAAPATTASTTGGFLDRAGNWIANNPMALVTGGLTAATLLSGQDAASPEEQQRQNIANSNAQRDADKARWNAIPTRNRSRPRQVVPDVSNFTDNRVIGGERKYFAEGGGITEAVRHPNGYLQGAGDGMSDDIPATAYGESGTRDVNVADGEYVIAADVVSGLGNGSSEAGVRFLDDLCSRVRSSRSGGEQPEAIDPNSMLEG